MFIHMYMYIHIYVCLCIYMCILHVHIYIYYDSILFDDPLRISSECRRGEEAPAPA